MACSLCGSNGPFYGTRNNGYCKPCHNAYMSKRRQELLATESPEEREQRLERRRLKRHGRAHRIRHKRSPEEAKALARANARAYYLKNRENRLAYQKARREADLEAARASERAVYRRRRHKHKAASRARERKMSPPSAETVAYEEILRNDPCTYCGEPMQHIDHIDPVSLGGANDWTNLTAACQSCNRAKSAEPLLFALLEKLPSAKLPATKE